MAAVIALLFTRQQNGQIQSQELEISQLAAQIKEAEEERRDKISQLAAQVKKAEEERRDEQKALQVEFQKMRQEINQLRYIREG